VQIYLILQMPLLKLYLSHIESNKKASHTTWTLHIASPITNHTCTFEDRTRAAFVVVQALIILTRSVLHEICSEYQDNAMFDSKNLEPLNTSKTCKNENVPSIAVECTAALEQNKRITDRSCLTLHVFRATEIFREHFVWGYAKK
jgi:hypothetical protein